MRSSSNNQRVHLPAQTSFLAHHYDAEGHCIPQCLGTVYQLNHGQPRLTLEKWNSNFYNLRGSHAYERVLIEMSQLFTFLGLFSPFLPMP